MQIHRHLEYTHPLINSVIERIEISIIQAHNVPFRLFETSREHARHDILLKKGKTKDIMSAHLYNIENEPPLYCTAFDYVYYDGRWSWNLRDSTVAAWYILFGNLVLDICPELIWKGSHRKNVNYTHFELRSSVIFDNIDKIPCTMRL
jgi:hypothetical protein